MDRVTNIAWRTIGDATFGGELPFSWNYLDGSDLKSALAYPNGLIASWTYDANNQLLQVCNATPTNVISQYDYAYDAAGRRINMAKSGSVFDHNDSIAYGYNARSELTNAVAVVDSDYRYAYDFDGIGNRETSSERGTNSVYTANNLNQYTVVDDFTPQLDDDGNQTLVKTATGVWQISYNGENRPVLWRQGIFSLAMSYDRMGRRVKVVKSNGQSVAHRQTFSYNGYLQIQHRTQETETPQAFHMDQFIWDPTDPIATRPLLWNRNNATAYYTHDGSKNVSEVVVENGDNAAHYEYAPFGTATMRSGAAAANPLRFSSEFIDDMLGLVYYNFRHYEPVMGRWLQWDPIDTMHYLLWRSVVGKSDVSSLNLSGYIENAPNCRQDKLGLTIVVNPVISKCCRKGDQYRSVYGFLSTPCCNKDETEVPSHECGCRACGERVKSHAEDVDGCIGDPGMDGYGDAFRHCYASCVMARTCGRFCAFAGGWYHELETPSEFFGREAWQDVANNSRGRDLASRGIDCLNGCLDLLYSGQLTVFNRQNRPFSREQAEECFNRNNARNQ